MAETDQHPFAAGVYQGVQTYITTVEDRVRHVKTFDLAQCRAALRLPGLQKTVERAVHARVRQLEKPLNDVVQHDSGVAQILRELMRWHTDKVAHLRQLQDVVKAGTTLKHGETAIVMTDRDALLFTLGVEGALAEMGKLPLKMEGPKGTKR